jgi:hypothetical protein
MKKEYPHWSGRSRINIGSMFLWVTTILLAGCRPGRQSDSPVPQVVSAEVMEEVFQEVSTPYKYGVVYKHPDPGKMVDSPTIFRTGGKWYMTYIVFDGRGYETWLAESDDLLEWKETGRILSFSENTWDANQKAGYVALVNTEWGGSYDVQKHNDLYWMSYLGGATEGYEAGKLGVGMANTTDIATPSEWNILTEPVLLPDDSDARWFETDKIYKSSIIFDEDRLTGYPFVMYYNAKGDTARYESIGMAVS